MSEPGATEGRIIKAMVGRELNNLFPPHEPQIGRELFRVEDWTAYHPIDTGRMVVDHASFTVHAGEIVGFAGLMGAGRTELAMSLFGRLWGTNISGRVFKDGKEISTATVDEAVAARHRLRHRGPQALRPQPDRDRQHQHLGRRAGAVRQVGHHRPQPRVPHRRGVPAQHEHQDPQRSPRSSARSPAATSRRSC